jgi:hypothetical protein
VRIAPGLERTVNADQPVPDAREGKGAKNEASERNSEGDEWLHVLPNV